jgi:uncharacterized protein (TIGR02145 family)
VSGNLAPKGWHVPTLEEWNVLQEFLTENGYSWDQTQPAEIAKAMATKTAWLASVDAGTVGNNTSTNNSSGFSAVPSGIRNGINDFEYIGEMCAWGSTTEWNDDNGGVLGKYLAYDVNYLAPIGSEKMDGLSIRCVRDY